MKQVKCLLVFLAALFCVINTECQTVDLRLDSVLIGFSATLNKDSAYSGFVTINNDSNTVFVGKINIGGAINGNVLPDDTSQSGAFYYSYNNVSDTIYPHSLITRSLIINTHNADFVVGSSGVVIWPIAESTTNNITVRIADSLRITFNVLPAVGIDVVTARSLKVYMSGQQLIIQDNGAYLLKNVNLYDVRGNLLQKQQLSLSGAVDMNRYASGVYFAEINFADDVKAVIKVVNIK